MNKLKIKNYSPTLKQENDAVEYHKKVDENLCFYCDFICTTIDIPQVITSKHGRVIKCDNYQPDGDPENVDYDFRLYSKIKEFSER